MATNLDTNPHSMPRGAIAVIFSLASALVVTAVVIGLRDPLPLVRAEFWAEDATEFFFGAAGLGLRSLVTPVYGQYFFASRLIAYVASLFPVLYTPYLYAWACLALNALAASYFVRDGFSWLVGARWQRWGVAVLLAIVPGASDTFLYLAGLPAPLALLGLLLLLEQPFRPGWTKTAVLVVLIFSSGQMILWLPVIAYLFWVTRRRVYVFVGSIAVLAAALNTLGNHEASAQAHLLAYDAGTLVPRIAVENFFSRLLPGPILGPAITNAILLSPPAVFWTLAALGLGSAAVVAALWYRNDRVKTALLGLAYVGSIASLVAVAVSRRYAIPQLVREAGTSAWTLRYSFLPAAVAILVWSVVLRRISERRTIAWRVAGAVGFASLAIHVAAWWPAVHARPDLRWPERSAAVQATLDATAPRERVITIFDLAVQPVGWKPNNARWFVVLKDR